MAKIFNFDKFKEIKKWDDEYFEYLSHIEKYFGTKIEPETLLKRLYYTVKFLEGTSRAFFVFSLLGLDISEAEKGKKYIINWLEEIIDELKQY